MNGGRQATTVAEHILIKQDWLCKHFILPTLCSDSDVYVT